MGTLKVNLLAVAVVGMALAGCQSSRMDPVSTAPAPLQPAPSGSVSQSQLPPPGGANQFPTAPTTGNAAPAPQGLCAALANLPTSLPGL